MSALPVLWLYGPPGVGKTTVAWELFVGLVEQDVRVGYVDIDQLGMCYGPPTSRDWSPEPADDPGRHQLKARALDAIVPNFRAAGARGLIVAGVTDPGRGVPVDLVPQAELTACRLRVEPDELRRRLGARGRPLDDFVREREHADLLDHNFATSPGVDTTGRTVAEVADQVRARVDWPIPAVPSEQQGPGPVPDKLPGEVLWLVGPAAIGKSSVGWQVYQQSRQAGVAAAFLDLDQLGFCRPELVGDSGNHRLKAANLAAIWKVFRDAGAQRLIVVGPIDRAEDAELYPATQICQLTAGRRVLAERVGRRGRGLTPTWGLAGDELAGQPEERLREVVNHGIRILAEDLGGFRVNTDDRSPDEIAAEILAHSG